VLACFGCQNLERFVQVSSRDDAREIHQTMAGVRLSAWDQPDTREPGVYCLSCAKPVDIDVDQLGLTDDRIDFVRPDSFEAEALAAELIAMRSDADWERLELPATPAVYADLPAGIHDSVVAALTRTDRLPLYQHQAGAISGALAGEHVVQATSAGSGKSLGFLIPVLDALVRNPKSTAILVFPMKALANDQLAAIERLAPGPVDWADSRSFDLDLGLGAHPIRVARFDGDALDHERREMRRSARLLIATPDILHHSVLMMSTKTYKDGTSWRRLLGGLRVVVLDELHAYQGVFGSNVANVIRRLRRVAAHYGATPQFLTASATIGNPVELAELLTGIAPFRLVDEDGSQRARRVVLVCNPPEREVAAQQAKQKVAAADSSSGRIAPQTVAIELIANGALSSGTHLPIRTIAFARARTTVFQLAQRLRNALKEARRQDLADSVASYAATFIADDRAEAEGKLRDGSTLAIVSTSALELGIDIPDLSLAVLVGYPGQISSFRQRIGRVGRRGEGLAVLIVGDDPLQQYLARDPEALRALLDAPAETVVINPEAPELARRYGLWPAQEELGGIAFEDREFFGDVVDEWLADAKGAPSAMHREVPYWRVDAPDDAYKGLRNAVSSHTWAVMARSGKELSPIGTIDDATAPRDAFVPAVWTASDGTLYRVVGRDDKQSQIICEGPVDLTYITRGVPIDHVEVLADHQPVRSFGAASVGFAKLSIRRQVFSYKEQHFSGLERSQQVEDGWPPVDFQTDGLYVRLDPSMAPQANWEGAVRAFEHALLSVSPAVVACDPYDLDASSDRVVVYVYESFGGGIQIAEPTYHRFDEIIALAHEVVATCPCESGCPSCVMLARRPDGNTGLSKAGALAIIQALAHPGM
jgi:DEAD/DEAH box helicase domain-containing protein